MRFRLTDDQQALRAGTRELLGRCFGREALRAAVDAPGRLDRALWRTLGEAGFFALRLPETDGGVGLGLPEAVLVFEEAGRALLPGPLVATHLAAGSVPGAAHGETVVAAVDGELAEWLDAADVVRGDTSGAVPLRSVDPLTPLHRLPPTGRPAHTAGRPDPSSGRPGTVAGPLGAVAGPPDPVSGRPGAVAGSPDPVSGRPGAVAGSPDPVSGPPGAVAGSPDPVSGRPGAVAGPPGPVSGLPGTVSGSADPVSGPQGAVAGPQDPVSGPPDTVSGSPYPV
ncbi:acyl-CoA dehydrogenase family protein, partial [Streptomyces capoamus]